VVLPGPAKRAPWGAPEKIKLKDAIDGLHVGCFPDVCAALGGNPPDLVISL
jgi:hypothetical protein